jgi:hypothetical protein
MWLLRIFAIHAMVVVGILIRQQLLLLQNNNHVIMVVQAFTLTSTTMILRRNPLNDSVAINHGKLHPMKGSIFSWTQDKSDTYSNVEPSIISALEMSFKQSSETSNEQQQQEESMIVVKPSPTPMVVPIITTTDVSTTEIQSLQPFEQLELPPPPQQQQSELNIWVARGLLLLVAAIWGTNFAVRVSVFCIPASIF